MRILTTILCCLVFLAFVGTNANTPTSAPVREREDPAVPTAKHNDDGTLNDDFMAKHEAFVALAKRGGIELLFVGDSITQYWAKNGNEVWADRYAKLGAANFGIGGDRTQHVLWRMQNGELDGSKHPKVIVLLVGTNNTPSDDPDRIAEGISKIVAVMREKSRAKILLLGIFPRGEEGAENTAMLREKIQRINARIATLDNGATVRFLDLTDKLLKPDGNLPNSVMPDRLHLSPKGYRIWADAMEPLLKEMMGG